MLARRQFEHGDCLSQRTLRLRQTMQLRAFSVGLSLASMIKLGSDSRVAASFSDVKSDACLGSLANAEGPLVLSSYAGGKYMIALGHGPVTIGRMDILEEMVEDT
jgi:hypothetical protein